jgi:hypothetical protein
MRIGKAKNNPNTGSIDGGAGRGVPIDDEEEATPLTDVESDAFAVLDDDDDANPGDRRRDPLRRP